MATDLEWALSQYRLDLLKERYRLYYEYYGGEHQLTFSTQNFRSQFGRVFQDFSENFCSGVVDALSDRLEIVSFRSSVAETVIEDVEEDVASSVSAQVAEVKLPSRKKLTIEDEFGDRALEIWKRNNMKMKSTEVHTESLKMGDGYVIVWPDEEMYPAIWPQATQEMRVQYDPNTPGKVLRASKVWFDEVDGTWYLNVYTQDAIFKFVYDRKNTLDVSFEKPAMWKARGIVPNPYGTIPVFHFPNKVEGKLGLSELKDVIPLQNALNKSDIDMLVAMEFAAYKQRYVIGIDPDLDEETGQPKDPALRNYGTDRMVSIPGLKDEVAVGQWDATDLGQFLRVQEKFWGSAARVSGTPLHYFFITSGDFPSGEAMKSAEARFVKRISDRQEAFGNVWERVMLFALQIEGSVPEDLELEPQWVDAAPRSDAEIADTAVKKKAVGVSRSQILKELGYDDETIERMLEETDTFAASQALLKSPPPQEEGTNPNGQPRPRPPGTQGVRR